LVDNPLDHIEAGALRQLGAAVVKKAGDLTAWFGEITEDNGQVVFTIEFINQQTNEKYPIVTWNPSTHDLEDIFRKLNKPMHDFDVQFDDNGTIITIVTKADVERLLRIAEGLPARSTTLRVRLKQEVQESMLKKASHYVAQKTTDVVSSWYAKVERAFATAGVDGAKQEAVAEKAMHDLGEGRLGQFQQDFVVLKRQGIPKDMWKERVPKIAKRLNMNDDDMEELLEAVNQDSGEDYFIRDTINGSVMTTSVTQWKALCHEDKVHLVYAHFAATTKILPLHVDTWSNVNFGFGRSEKQAACVATPVRFKKTQGTPDYSGALASMGFTTGRVKWKVRKAEGNGLNCKIGFAVGDVSLDEGCPRQSWLYHDCGYLTKGGASQTQTTLPDSRSVGSVVDLELDITAGTLTVTVAGSSASMLGLPVGLMYYPIIIIDNPGDAWESITLSHSESAPGPIDFKLTEYVNRYVEHKAHHKWAQRLGYLRPPDVAGSIAG